MGIEVDIIEPQTFLSITIPHGIWRAGSSSLLSKGQKGVQSLEQILRALLSYLYKNEQFCLPPMKNRARAGARNPNLVILTHCQGKCGL